MSAAITLSVLAALLFAIAAACQQRAASRLERESPVRLSAVGLMRRLVRNRLWLTGWAVNLAAFMAQAIALHLGSIAVVQALLVTQLVFAILLGTVGTNLSVNLRDVLGAVSVSGGLAVLLSVRGAAPGSGAPDRERIVLAFLAASVAAFLLVSAASGWEAARMPAVRSALLGMASGLCFASTAVLIKLTMADLVHRGVAATAIDWPGYALIGSTVIGLLLGQQAFAAGPLPAALTAMNMTNPIASYLFAVLAFHAPVPTSPGVLAALSGTCVLFAVGVTLLAHSPSVRLAAPQLPKPGAKPEIKPEGEPETTLTPPAVGPRIFSRLWR